MSERFTVRVERSGDEYLATSPEHPRAVGRGGSRAASIARLAEAIDRKRALGPACGDEPLVEVNEGTCGQTVPRLKWTSPASEVTSIAERESMAYEHGVAQTRARARQVPGALQWIKAHADEYSGRWVAVGEHGLVAAADTFEELRSQLGSLQGLVVTQVT